MTTNTEVAILGRVLNPESNGLAPDVARYILTLTFQAGDQQRMDELAAKARDGALTEDEQFELDEYRRVGDLIALLHSKARRALKTAGMVP